MKNNSQNTCKRCGAGRIMDWSELSDDQKMLVERLPGSSEYSLKERKSHRFCTKCWHEEAGNFVETA